MRACRYVIVVFALVACKPKGLVVEVPGDNVELFIATSEAPCGADNGLCSMAPPDPAHPGLPGPSHQAKRWIINTDDLVTADRTVTDGVTQFLIEPDPSLPTIPALLAVSFDGPNTNALPTGFLVVPQVDVRQGKQDRLQLVLDPFTPLTAINPNNNSGERMQLWRKPTDSQPGVPAKTAACALVGHGSGATYPFESFSPPSDADCDDAEQVHECDKFAAFASTIPNDKQLTCLAPRSPQTQPCIIGGLGCTDGMPAGTGTCTPSRETYCTSSHVCADAEQANCSTVDCVSLVVTQQVQSAQYGVLCKYGYNAGVPCASTGSATVHVTPLLSQLPCDDVRISPPQNPLAFASDITLGTGPNALKVGVSPTATTDCSITIEVEAGQGAPPPLLSYIEVQVTTSGAAQTVHHHVIPVVIEAATTCSDVMVCSAVVMPDASETITQCK